MPLVAASFTFYTGVTALLPRGGGGFWRGFLRHSFIGRPSLSMRMVVWGGSLQAGGVGMRPATRLRSAAPLRNATPQVASNIWSFMRSTFLFNLILTTFKQYEDHTPRKHRLHWQRRPRSVPKKSRYNLHYRALAPRSS
jgi:hypothetical protein